MNESQKTTHSDEEWEESDDAEDQLVDALKLLEECQGLFEALLDPDFHLNLKIKGYIYKNTQSLSSELNAFLAQYEQEVKEGV